MRIALVYRSGGDFAPEHVTRLVKQIRKAGELQNDIVLLTDAHAGLFPYAEVIPLRGPHQGWWAKMEMYTPGVEGDLLYMDLDTTILGPLHDIAAVAQLSVLRGNVRKDRGRPFYPGYQSALMYLTEHARDAARSEWLRQKGMQCISKYPGGDDRFLETVPYWRLNAKPFQDQVPGQIQHFKKDIRKQHGGKVPADTRLVVFCGNPRPWQLAELKK